MGVQILGKGETVQLRGGNSIQRATVGMGWDPNKGQSKFPLDLDASVILRDIGGNAMYAVYYHNAKGNPYGDVNTQAEWCDHQGDNLTGEGEGDDEQIKVNLTKAPADVAIVDFCVTIYDAAKRGQTFGMVDNAWIHIVNDDSGEDLLRYDLTKDAMFDHAGMVFGRLVRNGPVWEFKAVGEARPEFEDLQSIANQILPTL
jgi:tellurium resistance protein TerD